MKLKYVLEVIQPGGQKESSTHEFEKSRVIIGRGGKSDIVLDNPLISLEHAEFELLESVLSVRDLKSQSGVQVNGVARTSFRLKSGDSVKLGDFSFHIREEHPYWVIQETRRLREVEELQERVKRIRRGLDLRSRLPSMFFLSALVSLVILIGWAFLPVTEKNPLQLSSGPLSSSHRMLETECNACHADPFSRVADKSCLACHALTEHAKALPNLLKHHPEQRTLCVDCHFEHRGDEKLILSDSRLCTSCHAVMHSLSSDRRIPEIAGFDGHPEFRVTIGDSKDETPLKLNHMLHLKPNLQGPQGRVTMQCTDCHHHTPDLRGIEPMTFEHDCKSCHSLGFDEKLPGKEVPHGDPDLVFNFIYAEYAKLFLASGGMAEESSLRKRPGEETDDKEISFTRAAILEQTRAAETLLFTKTACYICHQVSQAARLPEEEKSLFKVEPVKVPERWLPASIFSHAAHEEISCESCHSGVRTSTETSDLLLPRVATCHGCHTDSGRNNAVHSECMLCHSYHDSLPFPFERKRSIKTNLSEMIGKP